MDQLLWAPVFLSTIVACQFTLEVRNLFCATFRLP